MTENRISDIATSAAALYEDCDDPESYDDLCQAAADKLGFKGVYFN